MPSSEVISTGSPGVNVKLQQLLDANFLGEHSIRLRNVSCSHLVRQLNRVGLSRVEDSIRSKGWLRHCVPSISISQRDLPTGGFSEELIDTMHFKVLDGNHRVTAAKHIYGLEERIQFRVYLEFPAQEAKIIADGKVC